MKRIIATFMMASCVLAVAVQMITINGVKFPLLNLQGEPPPGWTNNSLALVSWYYPGGFSPDDITELYTWHQADDMNGNGDGSSGYSDGNGMGTWVDKKGNQNLTVANGGPTWENDGASTINSKAVVRFDGTDDCASMADAAQFSMISGGVDRGTTIVMVTRVDSVAVGGGKAFISKDTLNTGINEQREWGLGLYVSDNFLRFFLRDTVAASGNQIGRDDTGFSSTGVFILTALYAGGADPENSSLRIRADGAQVDDTNSGSGTYDNVTADGTSPVSVACRFTGALGAASNFMDFDVAELLFFTKELSAGEITQVESYLNARWASF